MNMKIFGNMTAHTCMVTTVLSILLLPVQAAHIVPPSPATKPVSIGGALVPVPASKPQNIALPVTLEMMTLNISRLIVSAPKTKIQSGKETLSLSVSEEIIRASKSVDEKAVKKSISQLERKVEKLVRRGKAGDALALLQKTFSEKPSENSRYYDRMVSQIASAYLYKGRLSDALALAEDALKRSGAVEIPKASWIAGLALWQMERHEQAANYFASAAMSENASEMMAASAAFWAARAYAKVGDDENKSIALQRAAQHHETFYGILARKTLGIAHANVWAEKDYPTVKWAPRGGYRVDPSLINAIIRQESRFNPNAKSHSGARGLMQLMPATAEYIAKKKGYGKELSASSITDPRFNMKLGQDYVDYLLKYRGIDGDIVSMLIAYNAGPGNLQKWRKRVKGYENDPLLLIEMLPVKETRDYVEHVMSNYWVYSIRNGKNPESLASLAQGQYHKYAATADAAEIQPIKMASN